MYADLDSLEPVPGDLVVARNDMRAWESEEVRGTNGSHIVAGEQALVLQTWLVGNQRRLKVFRNTRILVFSCPDHCVRRNWRVALPAPRLPASDCP